jgi:hypothetical protein
MSGKRLQSAAFQHTRGVRSQFRPDERLVTAVKAAVDLIFAVFAGLKMRRKKE